MSSRLAMWIAACALLLAIEAQAYRAADFHWLPPFLAMEDKPSLTLILDSSSSMLERAYPGPFNGTREYVGYFDPRTAYSYSAHGDSPHFFADNASGEWNGNFLNWAAMLRIDLARKIVSGGKFDVAGLCLETQRHGHTPAALHFDDTDERPDLAGHMSHMTPLRGPLTMSALAGENAFIVSTAATETRYALRVKESPGTGLLHAVSKSARVALIISEDGQALRLPQTGYADDIEEIKSAVNSVNPQGNASLASILRAANEHHRPDNGQNAKAADPAREQASPCSRQRVILISDKCGDLMDLANQENERGAQEALRNTDIHALCLTDSSGPYFPGAATHQTSRRENNTDLAGNFFPVDAWRELATAVTRVWLSGAPAVASGTAPAVSIQTRSGEGAAYQAVFFPPGQTTQAAPPWSGQVHAFFLDARGNLREDTNSNQRLDMAADKVIEFAADGIFAHVDADGNGIIDQEERSATALDSVSGISFSWSSSTWLNDLGDDAVTTQRSAYLSTEKKRYIMTFVDKNRDMVVNSGEIQDFALPAEPAAETLNSPEYFYNYLTLYESAFGRLGLDLADSRQREIHALRQDNPLEFARFQAALTRRQVDFIRGLDVGTATVAGIVDAPRSRASGGKTWRLGDIVFSSPTAVGKPAENYHLIYNDTTYEKFLKKYLHRRQVVYVGANDGMLHAFNGGFWNAGARAFGKASEGRTQFELGQELWAYVPYNLLAHLGWLMHPEYGKSLHAAYMDLKPRAFDARIFVTSDGVTSLDEGTYPGGWGTILVAGMRLGGAAMEVDINKTDGNAFNDAIDRTVTSAYVIMDVTDPESEPKVLAEISLPGQGFTTCVPAVMPMKGLGANKWYLVFGSGPADASGRADSSKLMDPGSDQPGRLFALDLSALITEKTVKTVNSMGQTSEQGDALAFAAAGSFISEPVCVDLDIPSESDAGKFSTDVVYFGTVAGDATSPAGKVYRLRTGNGPPENWQTSTLIDVGEPVSAAPAVTVDEKGSLWMYFGTGRLLSRDDISQTSPMGFYGIREPEIAGTRTWDTVHAQLLFDSSKIAVTQGTCGEGEFSDNCIGITQMNEDSSAVRDWAWLTSTLDQAPGWKHPFSAAGERVLDQAMILGGTVVFTSFIPNQDVCAAGGRSNLWSLYYKTGTPYSWPSLKHPGTAFKPFIELGPGPAAKPILHIGENQALTSFSQLTSGELTHTEITPPFPFKSGCLFWRKNTD